MTDPTVMSFPPDPGKKRHRPKFRFRVQGLAVGSVDFYPQVSGLDLVSYCLRFRVLGLKSCGQLASKVRFRTLGVRGFGFRVWG